MIATHRTRASRRRQSGSVMIVAVLILLVLTATALVLATSMRVELRASANHAEAVAAQTAAEGAVRYVMTVLARNPGQPPIEGDLETEGVIVGEAAFWLVRPRIDGPGLRAGVADEAGKLHLNRVPEATLGRLPGVGGSLAEDLIAWRTDEEAAVDLPGAGSEHYLREDPPYLPRHAPLESVEEMLLVRGWTRDILFDEVDSGETATMSFSNAIGSDQPLYELFTVYSYESAPQDAVNVNDSDRTALRDMLRDELSAERFEEVWSALPRQGDWESVLEFYADAGLTPEEYALIEARLTVGAATAGLGLVNAHTASEAVLAVLPGMDENAAAALVDARAGRDLGEPGLAWVVEAIGDDRLAEVGAYLTGRSYQFTVDVVAIGATGRAFKRYRVVIDLAGDQPRVVRWSDWTELGWPLDPALRDALRAGVGLEEAVAMYGRVEP